MRVLPHTYADSPTRPKLRICRIRDVGLARSHALVRTIKRDVSAEEAFTISVPVSRLGRDPTPNP